MTKDILIPTPTKEEVEKYLQKWDSLENYALQESSLRKLYSTTYPLNNDIDNVLVKVCSLNDFYSTNIFSPFTVAKHIIDLKIDEKLSNGDLNIVNEIANITMNGGKKKNFYSFATKYCSHHKPDVYPIYDSFVEKILIYFKRKDKFSDFSNEDLKKYPRFKEVLTDFKRFYKLESFNIKQIDKYIWQLGKEYLPKNYSKKRNLT